MRRRPVGLLASGATLQGLSLAELRWRLVFLVRGLAAAVAVPRSPTLEPSRSNSPQAKHCALLRQAGGLHACHGALLPQAVLMGNTGCSIVHCRSSSSFFGPAICVMLQLHAGARFGKGGVVCPYLEVQGGAGHPVLERGPLQGVGQGGRAAEVADAGLQVRGGRPARLLCQAGQRDGQYGLAPVPAAASLSLPPSLPVQEELQLPRTPTGSGNTPKSTAIPPCQSPWSSYIVFLRRSIWQLWTHADVALVPITSCALQQDGHNKTRPWWRLSMITCQGAATVL